MCAALDALTLTCAFLILFTISSAEGGRYIDHQSSQSTASAWMKFVAKIAAPTFPLALFAISVVKLVLPWKKRRAAWTILSLTIGAPFHEVTFRDGFVGDVLTSAVRPLQDLAYTVYFTVPAGFRGMVGAWWSGEGSYTLDAAEVPLERSWLLHTVILPGCTLSP